MTLSRRLADRIPLLSKHVSCEGCGCNISQDVVHSDLENVGIGVVKTDYCPECDHALRTRIYQYHHY